MKKKRNGASPANPPRASSKGFHLFAGIIVGLLLAFLAFLHQQREGNGQYDFDAIKAKLDQRPDPAPPAPRSKPQIYFPVPEKPRYGFYQDLKEQEVFVPAYPAKKPVETQPLLLPQTESYDDSAEGTTTYILQAGSFRRAEDAERRKAELALLGLQARIELVEVPDGRWHRVRLGPFTSLQDANRVRTLLHSEAINTLLVTTKSPGR